MYEYLKIDENGYAIKIPTELPFNQRHLDSIQLEENEEIPEGYILAPDNTKPLWWLKWTGSEWVEGLPQAEIDELNNQPQEPTEIEELRLEQAQANAEIIELIITMIGGTA